MRKLLVVLAITTCFLTEAFSQAEAEKPVNNGVSWGIQLGQYQKDYGIGINLTSPYLFHDIFALRVRGNYQFLEHLNSSNNTVWTRYTNATFGIVLNGGVMKNIFRLYSEGGLIVLFPSSDFSSQSNQLGGYGVFGFEFYMDHFNSYFIEIGGVGTGAIADKVPTKPIYSNGLIISAGYRMTF